jgi:phage repressor protein C with HTH and peptisase S24 domain
MEPNIFENEFIRQGILSENELPMRLPSRLGDGMEVPDIIREALEATGLNQVQFAKKVGVGQGTISKWMSNQQSPNKRQWDDVEAFLAAQETTRHLVEAPTANAVAVRGLIGAGAQIRPDEEQVPPEGLYEVTAPFPIADGALAFRVDGESQWPRYDHGDVVICWAAGTDIDRVIGYEAAVRTADGHRYLKRVLRGSARGLFDLESYNAPTIRNVEIEWVARVQGVVRAADVREIARKQVARKARKA